jgi:6-phosphogluconolactonase
LVVPGGSSPEPVLARLAVAELPWDRVTVTLTDERWVSPETTDSNEGLIRKTLLNGRAAAARFVGLKTSHPSPEAALKVANEAIASIPRPFDIVVLGMGEDGHTASLFPGSRAGLDRQSEPLCVAIRPVEAPHARLSLSASALLDSRAIFLLILGEPKWRVYRQASGPGPVVEYPVRAVLHQMEVPVHVFWAP